MAALLETTGVGGRGRRVVAAMETSVAGSGREEARPANGATWEGESTRVFLYAAVSVRMRSAHDCGEFMAAARGERARNIGREIPSEAGMVLVDQGTEAIGCTPDKAVLVLTIVKGARTNFSMFAVRTTGAGWNSLCGADMSRAGW